MSEFSDTKEKRLKKLKELSQILLDTGNAHSFILKNEAFIQTVIPSDFITLFDELIIDGVQIKDLKKLTNKILNIFHLPLEKYERIVAKEGSFLGVMEQNNKEMEILLNTIRPVYKSFVKNADDADLASELLLLFSKLEVFVNHYTIKENVLFPSIEKIWPDYRCLQIMWSFHDDIRQNIKTITEQLSTNTIQIKQFNRCVGDVFFNMLAIKFREEHILFPHILSTITEKELEKMNHDGFEIGYPYIAPSKPQIKVDVPELKDNLVNLGTGMMNIDQIKLIFNHLPVDITYVDEHNKVCYFSTPKKRIFPRTEAIIGRELSNCHPPESVHIVEQIVESFKNKEKDQADFWIKMKGEYILIQYFAVRDEKGIYRGVIEVSQEISEIKALEGEKRLLD